MYGASSLGMSVQFHYCCGKLKDINITNEASGCGMDHSLGSLPCCDDKEVSLKISSVQHATKSFVPCFEITPQLSCDTYRYVIKIKEDKTSDNSEAFAPPPPNNYLLDLVCTYRI